LDAVLLGEVFLGCSGFILCGMMLLGSMLFFEFLLVVGGCSICGNCGMLYGLVLVLCWNVSCECSVVVWFIGVSSMVE